MIERLKTILLTVLVLLSLLQSFFLMYSMPNYNFEKKTSSDYIKTEPLGPEERLENLVFPEQMILHLGEDKHAMLYPGTTFYNIIMKRLQGRTYDGFQYRPVSSVEWERVRKQNEGIELRFNSPVPAKLLQRVFPLGDDTTFLEETIKRIWLYANPESNEVRVFFFNAKGDAVYESTRADLTVQDVTQQVEFGRTWTPYRMVGGMFYMPEEPLEAVEVELPYEQITVEQMQRSLFFDPTLTKNIVAGNSEIYTDAKRGLEINRGEHWIIYSDPAVTTEGKQDIAADATSAVRFINQHGGWNGKYRFTLPGPNERQAGLYGGANERGVVMRFEQYWGSYPVISTPEFHFGYMQVTIQQGTVTNYERSLIQLFNRSAEKEIRKLPAGDALLSKLKALGRLNEIVSVDPVYVPHYSKETIHLVPTWQVKFNDGSTTLLE
ncbi:two-component system activity regulator YycH [Paenibacillus melissococcoides]|uniref:Two-component system activity regulator YycH n=1 Tax=Paenibacillus melissococcoides TaxID=2912268 RepID=A0ABM9G7L9_9BACL|nr:MULTISPECIES: two-component system activity regulator YycH [Paenibacillus]MEB9893620.1 two-component system activity regulator YycH [Bacillus cereus]CAH8247731.1 two-component system activity regulator YycH [Paenibacillus melissococcoides]CAH8705797.1 two-component system activity regulator YycH [Paenibacillus melissococcoides]CAH8715270.1 two-component system activity regulator YycH [Paenibacillus melissococcoides]GIO80362.1 hypothetical protein J6TS7_39720 [Paenibacillus dendritiformis]